MRRKDPSLEAKWREHLAKFRRSNLTVVEYCRKVGISQSAFFRRRQELDPTWRQGKSRRGAAKKRTATAQPNSPFVPVTVALGATAEIELPSGVRIRVPATDRQALATVLTAAMSVQEERS